MESFRQDHQARIGLVGSDIVAFTISLVAATWVRFESGWDFFETGAAPWREITIAAPWVLLVWLGAVSFSGGYRLRTPRFLVFGRLLQAIALTFLISLSGTFFYRGFSYSRGMIAVWIPLLLVLSFSGREAFRILRTRVLGAFAGRARVVLIGWGPVAQALYEGLLRHPDYYLPVGVIAGGTRPDGLPEELTWLGPSARFHELAETREFDAVIMTHRDLDEEEHLACIETCHRHNMRWQIVPALHELMLDRAQVELIDGIPVIGMRSTNIVGFNWMVKRGFDLFGASLMLLLLSPIMVGVALAIRLSSRGPIFYVQERVGYRGQVFRFFKFRSMHVNNDDAIHRQYTQRWIEENAAHEERDGAQIHKIVDDPRIFRVGRWIRRYSVDELPQLLNVMKGDMSLIGPRPSLPYEVEVYKEWHRRRFEAPPGITGLWQVSGRNRLSFDEMVRLDIEYMENWSLMRDLHILFRTIRVVLFEPAP